MTHKEEEQVIRICGANYEETDIPTYIRNRSCAECGGTGEVRIPAYVSNGSIQDEEIQRCICTY